MKPTICVAIYTYKKDKPLVQRTIASLKDLKPDEVCFVDTSMPKDTQFQEWLYEQSHKAGIPLVKIEYIPNWTKKQTIIVNKLL